MRPQAAIRARARIQRFLPPLERDEPLLRWGAAGMTIAAGVIHVGQVGIHFDEDWTFGAFFVVVGALQLVGGLYLLVPLGPRRAVPLVFGFGILGSLATVFIWALSRTFGLPFGAEPGAPEQVGLADAAADLFEIFTAWLLALWLRRTIGAARTLVVTLLGSISALGIAGLWMVARAAGRFDPDPRLVAVPELVDTTAIAFLLLVATLFAVISARELAGAPRRIEPRLAPLLAALLLTEAAFTAFTLPARGGQNRDCLYGPVADDSGLAHAEPAEPIALERGETRSAVILMLVACSEEEVEITAVFPTGLRGDPSAVTMDRFTIEKDRVARDRWVAERSTGMPVAGARLVPGGGRYPLAVQVTGRAAGRSLLTAVRINYRTPSQQAGMWFATIPQFCVELCTLHDR